MMRPAAQPVVRSTCEPPYRHVSVRPSLKRTQFSPSRSKWVMSFAESEEVLARNDPRLQVGANVGQADPLGPANNDLFAEIEPLPRIHHGLRLDLLQTLQSLRR